MRTYRKPSAAELDARKERQAAARRTRDRNRLAGPERDPLIPREPGEFLLRVNGQEWRLDLRPDPRACRRWYAWRDGSLYMHSGLEDIWRKVMSEYAPRLSDRAI